MNRVSFCGWPHPHVRTQVRPMSGPWSAWRGWGLWLMRQIPPGGWGGQVFSHWRGRGVDLLAVPRSRLCSSAGEGRSLATFLGPGTAPWTRTPVPACPGDQTESAAGSDR